MMNIDESNQIIKDVIYKNMVNSIKIMKIFDEFGYFKYAIFSKGGIICLGFKSDDFYKVFEYSGKEVLSSEFKDYEYELDVNELGIHFNIVLKINVEKYIQVFEKIPKDLPIELKEKLMTDNDLLRKDLEQYAINTSVLFSQFRVIYYSSVIKKIFVELIEKKSPSMFIMKINHDNLLYVLPMQEKITLIFGINFSQKTDMSLAKVFLQELEDSKRHVKSSVESKYYPDFSRFPIELKDIEKNPKQFSCGFISFNLFIKNYSTLSKKLGYFINFRNYIQYHIHSIKTYLHIRMNKKGKELERKLNETKIISDDYLKSLDTMTFYSNWQKKEDDIKLFVSDFKKVNV